MTPPRQLGFERARVLVVGDAILDRYWHGKVERISREAPVPIMEVGDDRAARPGGAANVACNLGALGAKPVLCGLVADDPAGETLRGLMADMALACEWQLAARGATTAKLRLIGNRQQQLMRLDFGQPFADADAGRLSARAIARMDAADLVVLSDYGMGALSRPAELIDAARVRGLPVLVDPKGRDFSRYRRATLLTPNRHELENAAGACPDEAALRERASALRERLELDHLLVTRGAEGATLFGRDAPPTHVAAVPSEVYDVTGAGDTVIAVIAAALASGRAIEDAVRLANTAASVAVERLGTAVVTEAELLARAEATAAA